MTLVTVLQLVKNEKHTHTATNKEPYWNKIRSYDGIFHQFTSSYSTLESGDGFTETFGLIENPKGFVEEVPLDMFHFIRKGE